jgi:hypothetical protein
MEVASCLRGALPPVDLRAVCLVRAISTGTACGFGWWNSIETEGDGLNRGMIERWGGYLYARERRFAIDV